MPSSRSISVAFGLRSNASRLTVEAMITVSGMTKRYGDKTVVDDLSFTLAPGAVTGFLGPNGAGKSTTIRCILGLAEPDAGGSTILGKPYRELPNPLRQVGALVDARARHPGRSGYAHLLFLARSNGIGAKRVREVLELVGLGDAAGKRVGGFSLGMGQRLGVAAALLGDPPVLILDEPTNGLDPDGIIWLRELMRSLAAQGRTVLLSSHLMSEMQDTADNVIVIGQGRLLADESMHDIIARASHSTVDISTPQVDAMAAALNSTGHRVNAVNGQTMQVLGMTASQVGDLAFEHGIRVHQLADRRVSLEQAYLELTRGAVEYNIARSAQSGPDPQNAESGPARQGRAA